MGNADDRGVAGSLLRMRTDALAHEVGGPACVALKTKSRDWCWSDETDLWSRKAGWFLLPGHARGSGPVDQVMLETGCQCTSVLVPVHGPMPILNVMGMLPTGISCLKFMPSTNEHPMKTLTFLLSMLALPALLAAQDGMKRECYPDGRVSKVYWVTDDVVHFVSFHENGKVKEKGGYINGRPHGRWVQFDAGGGRTCRAKFEQGQRTGKWELRTLDGISHRLTYRDNKLLNGKEYDGQGVLVAEHSVP